MAVQHSWSYKPLVHEVLGLHLNKVQVKNDKPVSSANDGKSYELDEADPFWGCKWCTAFP